MSVRRTPGFTLIELMIVVAIIAIIAAVAIPSILNARKSAVETRVIAYLRTIISPSFPTVSRTWSSISSRSMWEPTSSGPSTWTPTIREWAVIATSMPTTPGSSA